jgi:hypothetical protein
MGTRTVSRSFAQNGCLLVCLLVLVSACATPTVPVRRGTTTPHAIGVICLNSDGVPIALDDTTCVDDNTRVLVSGIDSVGAAMPAARTWLDVDESTPGFTPLHMPGIPGAIAMDPVNGHGYIAIPLIGWIVRVDLTQLAGYKFKVLDWQDVGIAAQDLLVVQTPEPRLYMADPANGRVVWLPLATFGKLVNGAPLAGHVIDVGGWPANLSFSPANLHIYVGHLAAGFVSVIDSGSSIAPPKLLSQISLVAQCSNGLDDDGDGTTDRGDSGCDGPDDPFEGNVEMAGNCTNGVDDDGDGSTDATDPGCAITPTTLVDACRNGIDDDGDGLTDYAVSGGDPGCSGWGDNSEWSEQVLCPPGESACKTILGGVVIKPFVTFCTDGIDNDGDGKTDSADSDCSVPGNASEGAPACADGIDNDGDGTTDLADSDCYNRSSAAEISSATALHTVVAATFDGNFVVVADRTRRALMVIDTHTDQLIRPVPGQTTPFRRASRLDLRDGIVGLSLPDMPLSLAAVNFTDSIVNGDQSTLVRMPQVAIGLAQVGVQFMQFYPFGTNHQVSIDIVQTSLDPPTETTLAAARPLLLIPGVTLDLPTTIPSRFAAFGSSLSTDANNNTVFFGLAPTTAYPEQRAETWRFTREGELPGGVGSHARLLKDGLLHDPTMNFCNIGVLPGDMLQVPVAATTACQGGGTFNFTVTAVHADTLEFDPASGVLDVPVTYDNQLTYDLKARKPWTGNLRGCVPDGAVAYDLRAGAWLVRGSRSGLLSTRLSADGECVALLPADAAASRVQETTLVPGKTAADVQVCPYAGEPLDPTLWHVTPFVHPAFTALLSPGCDSSIFDANGDRVVNVVQSIRNAEWVYGVTAGNLPRTTAAGANPVAMVSGKQLNTLYVIDQGAGLLQFVNVPDGALLDTPLD